MLYFCPEKNNANNVKFIDSMKNTYSFWAIFCLFTLFVVSCSKDDETTDPVGTKTSTNQTGTSTKTTQTGTTTATNYEIGRASCRERV